MKKLMMVLLGLALFVGPACAVFAQDTGGSPGATKSTETGKKGHKGGKKGHKGGKKGKKGSGGTSTTPPPK